jgi:cytochrome P450
MNDVIDATPLPFRYPGRPAAPRPPDRRLGLLDFYRALRSNPITVWRADAFEQPVLVDKSPLGIFVLVNDPAAIRRVLLDNAGNYPKDWLSIAKLGPALGRGVLTAQGSDWRFQRRTLAPLFQPRAVEAYFADMVATVTGMLSRWETHGAAAQLPIADEMTRLTYEVISKTVFSDEIETAADVMGAAVTLYFEILGRIDLWDFVRLPTWMPRPSWLRVRPATRVFRTEVTRLLERRRARLAAGKRVPEDLVTLLLRARDPESGSALSDELICDNLVTFIGAGHETTANALSWTLYLLSEFPEAFARLAAEVDAVIAGEAPTKDRVERLVLTRMTLEEAMRLYPPIPFISRAALARDQLAGVEIVPGARVGIVPWVLHRHRALWQEPDLFEPERFAPARRHLIHRFAYLPFGGGPRVCIGAEFAMQEALIALAMIVRRFQPLPVPGAEIEPVARLTLRPSGGLPLRLVRRNG